MAGPQFPLDAVAGSQAVDAKLQAANTFHLPQVSEAIRNMDAFKIFNIFDVSWPQETGVGKFLIHACEPGFRWDFHPLTPAEYQKIAENFSQSDHETTHLTLNKQGIYRRREIKEGEIAYSRPCFVPGVVKEGIPIDLRKIGGVDWDGLEVCADILGIEPKRLGLNRPYSSKHPSQDLTKWGCFVAHGDEPSKEELAAAHKLLTKKMQDLWNEAQGEFLKGPNAVVNISELHRKADVFLRRGATWNQEAMQMIPCPLCGDKIFAGSAVHMTCGAVIDEAKVMQMKPKGFEHIWGKKKSA